MVSGSQHTLANCPHRLGSVVTHTKARGHSTWRLPQSQHDLASCVHRDRRAFSAPESPRSLVGGARLGPHVADNSARYRSFEAHGTQRTLRWTFIPTGSAHWDEC